MPGTKGKSGRKPKAGTYYRLYGIRFNPFCHPPEFEDFLSALSNATPQQRAERLFDVFLNGQRKNLIQPVGQETLEETLALDDMFDEF